MLGAHLCRGAGSGVAGAGLGRAAVVSYRLASASALRQSSVQTPIQKWGEDYVRSQAQLQRPISPHLGIYKPMLTWLMSGANRMFGCAMGGALLVGSMVVGASSEDFPALVERVRAWGIPAPLTATLRFVIAFPLIFHTLNSLRYLTFNMGRNLGNIGQVYSTGYAVIAASLLLSLVVVFWRSPKDQVLAARRH